MSNDQIQMAIESRPDMHDTEAYADWANEHAQAIETALRQHQQDGGWRPIETLTDAEGDIILLNSARNLVLSMDAKRWRSTIGYPDHLHFHADYWKQINPPAPKKEKAND